MGLPEINIEFKGKANNAIKRSAQGIVALILRDTTSAVLNSSIEYKTIDDVKKTDFTDDNYGYIERAFLGNPLKIIVELLGEVGEEGSQTPELVTVATTRLKNKKWNYLAFPVATKEENTTLSAFITKERDENKKIFKAVLANEDADHEGIINFTTDGLKVKDKSYTTAQYTSRIAGILAGLSLTRSATYFVLDEVDAITEHSDPNASIDAGELILINDGEKIKIGRGVNSLVTLPEPEFNAQFVKKTEDFKKIKVVEVMDMITTDVRDTFSNQYVGKVPNIYDNQVLFFAYINVYFKNLADEDILDKKYENTSFVNVDSQRAAWEKIGVDTTDWDDQKVKEMSFKSNVFAGGNIKIVDATEDLDFQIKM